MVVLVVNGTKLPEEDKLVELLRVIPGVSSIILNTNTAQTNVVLGKKLRTLWGEDSIEDSLHVLEVKEEPEQTDGQAALSAAAGISADDGAETSENNKSERSKIRSQNFRRPRRNFKTRYTVHAFRSFRRESRSCSAFLRFPSTR